MVLNTFQGGHLYVPSALCSLTEVKVRPGEGYGGG